MRIYQILRSVGHSIIRAFLYSALINDLSDSEPLSLVSGEPIPAHRFENNSSEPIDFDSFLSHESPSVHSSNNHLIDPFQLADVPAADPSTVELAPQAPGIDPSLLTTGPSILANISSQVSGPDSLAGYTSSSPMIRSTHQTLFDPLQTHQPSQFFLSPEFLHTGGHFQHSQIIADNPQFGAMNKAKGTNEFSCNAGNEWIYDHSILPDANATISSRPLSTLLSSTESFPEVCNGKNPINSLQPLSSSTVPFASPDSMALQSTKQPRYSQRQILNGTPDSAATSRRLFGPRRIIRTLPPVRRGGRRGPLSASQLEQRNRARKSGICIRCRKLKERVGDPISAGVRSDNSDPAFAVLRRVSLRCMSGEHKSYFVDSSLHKGSI